MFRVNSLIANPRRQPDADWLTKFRIAQPSCCGTPVEPGCRVIRMSVYCAVGNVETDLSSLQLKELLCRSLAKLGPRKRVLAVPPDITRLHSQAGALTHLAWEYFGDRLKAVLPAIGTHAPMQPAQLEHMFGDMPQDLFRVHNWRTDVVTLGEVPAEFIHEQSEGKLNFSWPAQVNRLIVGGRIRLDSLHRPGGAARSDRHGQLHQEHSGGHGRPGQASTAATIWARSTAWSASWGEPTIRCARC